MADAKRHVIERHLHVHRAFVSENLRVLRHRHIVSGQVLICPFRCDASATDVVVEHLLLAVYLKGKALVFGRVVAKGRDGIGSCGVRQLCVLHDAEIILVLIWQPVGPTAVDQIVVQNLSLLPRSLDTTSTAVNLVRLLDEVLGVERHASFDAFLGVDLLENLHIVRSI